MWFEIGIGLASFIGGWIIREIFLKRNVGIAKIMDAVKNKDMLVFLESQDGVELRRVIKKFQQIAITDRKEIILITQSSMKHCARLGIRVGFGDFFRAITVPKEVIQTKEAMLAFGFSGDEIAWFFKEIHDKKSGDKLKSLFEAKKAELKMALGQAPDAVTETISMYQMYVALPFTVKDFILSGMNQTTFVSELRNLVAQRELEKLGGRNWITIAIAIAIVLIIIGIFAPDIIKALSSGGAPAAPVQLPNPLASAIGK